MAARNDGTGIRHINDGTVEWKLASTATSAYDTIIFVKRGTVEIDDLTEAGIEMKKGRLLDQVMQGDQLAQTIRMQIDATTEIFKNTGSTSLRELFKNTWALGVINFHSLRIRWPDYVGATTGQEFVFDNVWVPDNRIDIRGEEDSPDSISIVFQNQGAQVVSEY